MSYNLEDEIPRELYIKMWRTLKDVSGYRPTTNMFGEQDGTIKDIMLEIESAALDDYTKPKV